jgi:nuclear transport factor 2 (NTF2) superfamily protein
MSTETTPAIDPVAYLRGIEAAWQARDGQAAAAGYADDALLIFGNGQQRTGDELRRWPQQWFDFATDLKIEKSFRAFSGDCLASEWRSEYTHPQSGKRMHERGAEFFWIDGEGKVYRHHMFEHTWPDGEQSATWPAV